MSNLRNALGALVVAAAMSACSSYGPGGVHYSTTTPNPEPVGATLGSGGGSLSGGGTSEPAEKEKRANTPIGLDRDGHGPAAGAIVDPTGAATRGKPY